MASDVMREVCFRHMLKKSLGMEAEELEAVRSVYCEPDEFELITHDQYSTVFSIRLPIDKPENKRVTATFTVSPAGLDVSFQDAHFTRASLTRLKEALVSWRSPDTSVWGVFDWIKDNAGVYLESDLKARVSEVQDVAEGSAILIQLDHVRDAKKYAKTLSSACESLRVTARLLLLEPRGGPLVVARGSQGDVKEFCKALKTRNVDVDSKGVPCKERMARVLFQGPVGSLQESREEGKVFDVVRCSSSEDVRLQLESLGLRDIDGIV